MGNLSLLHDYNSVRQYLYSLKHRGAKFGIDRMRLLADALGHPERDSPAIHVAGTNGKGSVCAMLEAIHRGHGRRTGLYTSPHLVRQGERVQVDRQILQESEIVELTRRLHPVAERLASENVDNHPSFFEFMTAMAFLRFQEAMVDVAIIETGLGGRLDATNVVDPEISVITSIGLDHLEILGGTLEKIAGEKAGILKEGRPVVIGCLPESAEAVVRRRASELGCPLYSVRERFGRELSAYPETNLAGSFQRINAGVALLTTEVLNQRFPVDPERCRQYLRQVWWPGRWQEVPLTDRTLILDATHNPEGCVMLEENLGRLVKQMGKKPDILLGTLGSFRAAVLLKAVAPYARNLHLLVPDQPRATSFETLETLLPTGFNGGVFRREVAELFPRRGVCTAGAPGETVVATGSIYLIGEMADRLFNTAPVGQSDLQDPVWPIRAAAASMP